MGACRNISQGVESAALLADELEKAEEYFAKALAMYRELPDLNRAYAGDAENVPLFLQQINISTGIVAALVAMFVLVLSDAGLNRRKLTQ